MKNQHGFASVPVLIFAFVGLLIVGGWIYYENRSADNCVKYSNCVELKRPANNQDENEVSNWQTYRNEEYGFEFQYPNSWKEMDKVEGGPITAIAPQDYVFKDGTEAPYGFFIVSNMNNREDWKSTDWEAEAFLGDVKYSVFKENGIIVTMILPYSYTKNDLDKILSTFKFTK